MKACVLIEPGPAENLKIFEVRDPGPPEEGQVLMKVEASGIDGHDLVVRQGIMRGRGEQLEEMEVKENGTWIKRPGLILGHEIAGTVLEVGPGVTELAVGDRIAPSGESNCGVCELCRTGLSVKCTNRAMAHNGYAEMAVVPARSMMRIPDGISAAEACIVRCAIGTCLRGFMLAGEEPKFHHNILICGAGGGLGIHALQIAALTGGFVMATTTSDHKIDMLKRYGASEVIYSPEGKFNEQVMKLTKGHGADYIIDTVGGTTFNNGGFRSLAYYGRYVFVGQINDEFARFAVPYLFWREAVLTGCNGGMYVDTQLGLELMEQKRIEAVISERFKLEDTPKMHGLLEKRQITGRAVIDFS